MLQRQSSLVWHTQTVGNHVRVDMPQFGINIARPDEAYFWAKHQGAELDLLMLQGGRRSGVELWAMLPGAAL